MRTRTAILCILLTFANLSVGIIGTLITKMAYAGGYGAGAGGGLGGGTGAPTDATYWVSTANSNLSNEISLGALTTGLVLNTGGIPSQYAGTACTNQFARSLNPSGAATCASVSLTADVTGTLPVGSGGTGAATITGVPVGNATSAFTALTGNTCAGGQFANSINAAGQLACATPAGGGSGGSIFGGGATNTLAKFTGSTSIGNSLATDNGITLLYTGTGGVNAVQFTSTTGGTGRWIPCGVTSGCVTVMPQDSFTSYSLLLPSSAGNANEVLLSGGGTSPISYGLRSGTTTKFATVTGSLTSGNCAKWDSAGNLLDAGTTCGGSGGGSSITVSSARLTHSTTQTLTNNTTTILTFDTEISDAAGMHSGANPTRITIPANATCTIYGSIRASTISATSHWIGVLLNGTTYIGLNGRNSYSQSSSTITHEVTTIRTFGASDYIELVYSNGSGSNMSTLVSSEYSPIFAALCFN